MGGSPTPPPPPPPPRSPTPLPPPPPPPPPPPRRHWEATCARASIARLFTLYGKTLCSHM
ncbi:MAG: hypothetical protein IPF83_13285 [Rhodanobacteraceae bacterium]|nr:hypothetical protein [Rhodanobacteraceae bacterium]